MSSDAAVTDTASLPRGAGFVASADSGVGDAVGLSLAASPSLRDDAARTLSAAVDYLLARQHADGYWCAELEGDSILQSEYILMKWMLGQEATVCAEERLPKITAYLRRQQTPGGFWTQYPGGKMDLSATVKAYFCLKLAGDDIDAPHMRRARELILAAGGAERINSFSKFYLAGLGQVSYDALPSIPPELVFLPRWFYFHMDKISAWSRTMIAPLSIVTTFRPVRELPEELGISELFVDPKNRRRLLSTQDRPHPFWSRFFLQVDKGLKLLGKLGQTPPRSCAVKKLESWMIDHLENTDGLGAIFPPMVYIQVALRALGYPDDHPILVKARKDLDDLMIEDTERDEIRIQPCFSPVWDTGIAAYALTEAGLDASHPGMRQCAQWLIGKECKQAADWAANVRERVQPSGWYFEYNNPFYPDVDDTAMVSMSLHRIGGMDAVAAGCRGVAWILAMQNDDGGWAAFDRTKDRPILEHVPFADHNAIQDPSCPDITGRVLECLGNHGVDATHPAVQRATAYMQTKQEPDGAYFGRWGVNYVYGTFQVLVGLESVKYDMTEPWVRRAGQWLKDHQKKDGSFGESPDSYEDPSLRGQGPSTASQTAWGAMGLMAVFGPDDPDAARAVEWLCDTCLSEGTWHEPWFTGTGFPRVFYLRYHLYRHYFPVMALARWLRRHDALPSLG